MNAARAKGYSLPAAVSAANNAPGQSGLGTLHRWSCVIFALEASEVPPRTVQLAPGANQQTPPAARAFDANERLPHARGSQVHRVR